MTLPYRIIEDDEILGPTYIARFASGSKLRERTVRHVQLRITTLPDMLEKKIPYFLD